MGGMGSTIEQYTVSCDGSICGVGHRDLGNATHLSMVHEVPLT